MILCCLHFGVGNYGLLQVVAWSKMLVDYSAELGLLEGASNTFDGEHPCEMCKQIVTAKKKDAEKPQDHTLLARESVMKEFIASEILISSPPTLIEIPTFFHSRIIVLNDCGADGPPVPPPRIHA